MANIIRTQIAEKNKKFVIEKNLPFLNIHKPININAIRGIRDIHKNPGKNTKLVFFPGTTNQAIHYFNQMNLKCAVMNFANSHYVGGGYLHGSMAQEEELCRTIIDLYPSLCKDADRQKRYNNFNWHETVKYNANLNLYRFDSVQSGGTYDFFATSHISVSVITLAAPNLRWDENAESPRRPDEFKNFILNPNQTFQKIKNIIKNGCLAPIFASREKREGIVNVLVLGAIGCGAFSPPKPVEIELGIKYNECIAILFADVLRQTPNLMNTYDFICFAIPPGENYDAFEKVFSDPKFGFQINKIAKSTIK
jgi:uncharacterized protein (TIGR02452 family)